MKQKINNEYPVHEFIAKRWSGRSYSDKPVSSDTLKSLFEAARWAPSSYNEQPWRFIVTEKGTEAHDRLFSTLIKFNQSWVIQAPVLVLVIAKTHFSHNQSRNHHYMHDVGLAMGNLLMQATALNLNVHIMAGFNSQETENLFKLPSGFEAITIFTIGYRGNPDALDDDLKQREIAPGVRKLQNDFVFYEEWMG